MTANTTTISIRGVHFHTIADYDGATYLKKDSPSFVVSTVIEKYIIRYARRGPFTEDGSADGCVVLKEAVSLD
jgi:hypothetical protein